MLKNLSRGEDVVKLVSSLKDPMPAFLAKHEPTDLSKNEQKNPSKVRMYEQRKKRFLDREELLQGNTIKV